VALDAYISQVQSLLQNPAAPTTLYPTAALTSAINIARLQIAGEGQCIRSTGALVTTPEQYAYSYAAIADLQVGVQGVYNVRQMFTASGLIYSQPWEWYALYYLAGNQSGTPIGQPTTWAQQTQGVEGNIFLSPIPLTTITIGADCVCQPIALALDTDPEAIPYPWTDCVQYLGAAYALLAAQSNARSADSDRMFARYQEYSVRARNMSTATVLPGQYQQSGRVPPGAQQGGG
jgi:hypothetical protein